MHTLLWWSSRLGSGTRAPHGSPALTPIEIEVPLGAVRRGGKVLEIEVGDAIVRCDVGADVAYIASLVHALRGS